MKNVLLQEIVCYKKCFLKHFVTRNGFFLHFVTEFCYKNVTTAASKIKYLIALLHTRTHIHAQTKYIHTIRCLKISKLYSASSLLLIT